MKIVLIGAGGYGVTYLSIYENYIDKEKHTLCAVVDPYADRSNSYTYITEHHIPVFQTLDDFYCHDTADLVIISSPIQFHKEQTLTAVRHGSHVLCEKPLTARVEDALEMQKAAREAGCKIGVGFQWSFNDANAKLRKDIQSGLYGRPLCFKTCMSWPRPKEYFEGSTWKGRVFDKNSGSPIYDSIVTNATAHYLHNLFFIAASQPRSFNYIIYRAYDIETFDTCVIKGVMENGCEFFYGGTFVGEIKTDVVQELKFAHGTVRYGEGQDDFLKGYLNDGTVIDYGTMSGSRDVANKLIKMIECIEHNTNPLCSVDEIVPYLSVCNQIFEKLDVTAFPREMISDIGERLVVKGLWEKISTAFDQCELPASLL
ncbi:MAG: Gfo/Idh/MocA family oxidoreductase [Clostridiaceae bacterium]|nr:Gfo/Idh/MocA family oxidoreductase [Clostridiaceae bacterium]